MKMDVERIQKINALALDLLKQGLASSRDEAVVKAEAVFRDRDSEPYSEMRSRMNENSTGPKDSEDLHPEKVKDILEKNTTFIVKKFKEFQEKMESMEKEIGYLRNKMLFSGPTSKEGSNPSRGSGEGSSTSAAKPAQAAAPSTSHPRSGNYNDTDVSIEKFFYMGHK